MRSQLALYELLAICLMVGGCATGDAGSDPGARPLPAGQSCDSIRSELTRLDARGVQALFDRKNLSASQRAEKEQYSKLLDQYLGARCHV